MSAAWAGGTDAIIERMDKMTKLFIKETREAMYHGVILQRMWRKNSRKTP